MCHTPPAPFFPSLKYGGKIKALVSCCRFRSVFKKSVCRANAICEQKKDYFSEALYRFVLPVVLALVLARTSVYAQKNGHSFFKSACADCGTLSRTFKNGEKLQYKLYYHWHFVWLHTGVANVSVAAANFYGIPTYYISAEGHTLPKYDWFYKIRDTITSYIDTINFAPLRFYRSTHEAAINVKNDNVFDNRKHLVYYLNEGKHIHRDSVAVPSATFDVLTCVYLTRCINFGSSGAKDTILLNIYLDGKIYRIHLRYLGKEVISTAFGRFRCEKLSVELIAGTIFKAGGKMIVWATDDANHLPLLVEAPIIIGTVRVELQSFSDLRNTMDAKVK